MSFRGVEFEEVLGPDEVLWVCFMVQGDDDARGFLFGGDGPVFFAVVNREDRWLGVDMSRADGRVPGEVVTRRVE